MKALYKFNSFIERWMPFVTPICLVMGVVFSSVFGKYAFIVPFLFAFMTFAGSLGSGFGDIKKIAQNPWPLLMTLFVLHAWMPVLAFGTASFLFPSHPYFITGIVLEFVVPTGVVSLVWVSIYKGNEALTIAIIILDTLLSPILVPLTLKLLIGSTVAVDAMGMVKDIVLMIAIPALLGMILHQVTKGEIKKTLGPKLAPFSKIGLIAVVTINSTKVAPFVKEMNPILLAVAATILFLAATGYVWSYLAARLLKADYGTTLAVTVNGGMRNISAGAVLALRYFPGEVMFPVMIGTLFQQILVANAVNILHKKEIKRVEREGLEEKQL